MRKFELGKELKTVGIRFTADECAWLEATAKRELRTVANLIRWIVEQYRKEYEQKRQEVNQ